MKTIKNIFRATSLCLLCTLCVSCSDFLEIKDLNTILLEDYWTQKSDVDDVVNGCYAKLLESGIRERMIVWGEGRGDNVAGGNNIVNQVNLYNVLRENITAMNTFTTWDGFYTVINRCNTVLKYAPMLGDVDPSYTRADLKATVAEMTALRSLCYFYLIRTFRDVPFSRTAYTDDDQKMDLPATPFYDVLDSLITDLESVKNDAVTRYPLGSNSIAPEQTGRITRDAIYAMLCEMYLWKQDYDNCVRYAELVIASKKEAFLEEVNSSRRFSSSHRLITLRDAEQILERTGGYPLVCDFLGTYGEAYSDIFVEGGSYETIFELAHDNNPASSGQTANQAISDFYGSGGANRQRGSLVAATALSEDATKSTGRSIYEDVNKALDLRLYTNFNSKNNYITKLATRNQDVKTSGSNVNENESSVRRTYYDDKNNGSNWVIYRLPDIMLLEAEALCQQMVDGSNADAATFNKPLLDKAFKLVNAVNKRSIGKATLQDADTLKRNSYNTRATMENLVDRERRRELMFEGKRYYDLVRYAMRAGNTDPIISIMSKRENVNSGYVQNFFKRMDAIFWPYNYEEMRVNRNLVPNPAFGTGENESYEKTAK